MEILIFHKVGEDRTYKDQIMDGLKIYRMKDRDGEIKLEDLDRQT